MEPSHLVLKVVCRPSHPHLVLKAGMVGGKRQTQRSLGSFFFVCVTDLTDSCGEDMRACVCAWGGVIVRGLSVTGSFNQPSPEVMKDKLATGVGASTANSRNKGRDMLTSSGGSRAFISGAGGGGSDSRRLNQFLEKRSRNPTFRFGGFLLNKLELLIFKRWPSSGGEASECEGTSLIRSAEKQSTDLC